MGSPVRKWQRLKDASGRPVAFTAGDTAGYTFILKDAEGTVLNLASKSIRFRCNSDDLIGSTSNKVFEKAGTLTTDGTDGSVDLALTPTELAAAGVGEDRHLYVIDITGSAQLVLAHLLVDILPEPDAS